MKKSTKFAIISAVVILLAIIAFVSYIALSDLFLDDKNDDDFWNNIYSLNSESADNTEENSKESFLQNNPTSEKAPSKSEQSSKQDTASKEESGIVNTEEPTAPEKITKVYSFKNNYKRPEANKAIYNDTKNGNKIPYTLYMPENYNSSNKYPIILFLHGAGEIGSDNKSHLGTISQMFTCNGDLTKNAFILCPQSYEWWNLDRYYQGDQGGTLGSALHLLEEITEKYSCDKNRIYVTGLSMGGYATWDLLEHYGDIFAAGIPICGGGNPSNGAAFKDIPIRIYHGTADTTVSFSASKNMYNAIVGAGSKKVELIQLDGVGHNAWDHAFSDRDTFCWLFSQNKLNNPNCDYKYIPYFKIVNSKGQTVIFDDDITDISYITESSSSNIVTVNLTLTSSGRSKLDSAYKSSGGAKFTIYWENQKICDFIATKPTVSNTFTLSHIIDYNDYLSLYKCIMSAINKREMY